MSVPERLGSFADSATVARTFVSSFARNGSREYISNLQTDVIALDLGGTTVPATINEAEYGQAFTCLPHSAYALYSRAELDFIRTGAARPFLSGAANALGVMLRAASVNRVVNVNNWMMSTNLHAHWSNAPIPEMRDVLVARFPHHFIAIRSLTEWANSELIKSVLADGWRLIPSRQIFVMDEPALEWKAHRNSRADDRLVQRLDYEVTSIDHLGDGDAERISSLYQNLYIDKYTHLNPAFTPSFIRMTHQAGVLRYCGARDRQGTLSAVVAVIDDGQVLCPQLVAYDQARPQSEGLYRTAMALGVILASQSGLKLNWSAGAGPFKASRGGRPIVEYMAFYDRHLSAGRRNALAALDAIVRSVVQPFVQSKML